MPIEGRKISVCIPSYNRYELLIESFINILFDERVEEIIITDDCSDEAIYKKVEEFISSFPKIKMFRNPENYDCYKNKYTSLTYAKNKHCVLFDSDNILTKEYIDKLYQIENWGNYAAMLPSFATPHFDYRKYKGHQLSRSNISQFVNDPTLTTCLNTANCLVDREFYIQCWDGATNPHTADSIYMNYLLLKNGGKLYIVPELEYYHRVDSHNGEESGHYNKNVHKTGSFHNEVLQKLKELR